MTEMQWLAFVILPLAIVCLGYLGVRVFEYANPPPQADTDKTILTKNRKPA